MTDAIDTKHTYTSSWSHPDDVERYLRTLCDGRTLNLCCGKSPLGDIRADADVAHNPDVLADMRRLPFKSSTFDTVVFDPPWKMGYYQRQKPFFEAVRVAAVDARILFNARWLGESKDTKLEEVVVRADGEWANVSTIAVHRKHPGQQTFENEGWTENSTE